MSASAILSDLAAEQWGLVTAAQARSLGVTAQELSRRARHGSLERLVHGVYRSSSVPQEPLDGLRAAWLTLDPTLRAATRVRESSPAVVSHRSAASIHGLGDLEADQYEFTTASRKQSRRPDIRFHQAQLDPDDWTVIQGLPVTTVIRTVSDLAEARVDGGHLASVIRDALIIKQANSRRLGAALAPFADRYGVPSGDGDALLALSLQGSGASEIIGLGFELADTQPTPALYPSRAFVQLSDQFMALQEQFSAIENSLTPTPSYQEFQKKARQLSASVTKISTLIADEAIQHAIPPELLAELNRATKELREAMSTPELIRLMTEEPGGSP